MDTKISELTTQKTDLQIEDAKLTALENVQNSNVARQMTTPAQTNYVSE